MAYEDLLGSVELQDELDGERSQKTRLLKGSVILLEKLQHQDLGKLITELDSRMAELLEYSFKDLLDIWLDLSDDCE